MELKKVYEYYDADNVLSATDTQNLTPLAISNEKPDYVHYPMLYYNNAEKIRSITVKESNYFNSLSSLSETF
jgi:hypothetical protein